MLKTFQQSREPVVFHNVTQKPSVRDPLEDDIIINKRSRVDPANNKDIQFEYAEPEAYPSHQFTIVQDIIRLEENQLTCQRHFDSTPRQRQTDPYEGWLFSLYVRTLHCF